MQKIIRQPIDFPLIDIKVEQIDCQPKAYISEHDNLKDAVLACESQYELFGTNFHTGDKYSDDFYIVEEYMGTFYVVNVLNQLYNLGDFN
jgi:hypothetical protein